MNIAPLPTHPTNSRCKVNKWCVYVHVLCLRLRSKGSKRKFLSTSFTLNSLLCSRILSPLKNSLTFNLFFGVHKVDNKHIIKQQSGLNVFHAFGVAVKIAMGLNVVPVFVEFGECLVFIILLRYLKMVARKVSSLENRENAKTIRTDIDKSNETVDQANN